MMGVIGVILLLALTGSHFGCGSPVRPTPQSYPQDPNIPSFVEGWPSQSGWYVAIPTIAMFVTAAGILGCAWCFRHKDKIFTASATHLNDSRRQHQPEAGPPEPVNNNISEANNNGPISLREMQNIANNNAAAYIVSENEERNRISRESVVEFEPLPLPSGIRAVDPLERCTDWFGGEDFPRSSLQYLREIGRGWFGRVVEGQIEDQGSTTTVAVKILNQNASVEDKARFLDEAKMYRDVAHENILTFVAKCLQEEPWVLIFELCSMDLQQYLTVNRPKMATLNENGVPLRLMCDISSALHFLHSRGYLYGPVCSSTILIRMTEPPDRSPEPRAVLGTYGLSPPPDIAPPEARRHPPVHTSASEVWWLGAATWQICAWGAPLPLQTPPPPDTSCPYANHLYQVMQLCWNPNSEERPTAGQVHALFSHLLSSHSSALEAGPSSGDFEARWQRLKPNSIPKLDEHVAIVHAPSTSTTSQLTGSTLQLEPSTTQDTLSVDMDTQYSRSSSIMSDKDPLSVQIKSESLTNLHGSLEDVRNIYLTHNETAALECHQGNMSYDDREHDPSDSSVDPWLKDIIAGSQDDVSYYKDVSDVIKNLDNILNSEKTSSSESSHHASPSRDNLSLDCKKEYPVPCSLVKSPGINNFQNIFEAGFDEPKDFEPTEDDEVDRDTVGTLSHSFERHSDTTSQHTLENITPDTPIQDNDLIRDFESKIEHEHNEINGFEEESMRELPKGKVECSSRLPNLKDLCVVSYSVSANEQLKVREDCVSSCDSKLEETIRTDEVKTKSIDNIENDKLSEGTDSVKQELTAHEITNNLENLKANYTKSTEEDLILPNLAEIREIAEKFVEKEVIQPALKTVSKIIQNIIDAEQQNKDSQQTKQDTIDVKLPSTGLIDTADPLEQTVRDNTFEVSINKSNDLDCCLVSQETEIPEELKMSRKIPELVQNVNTDLADIPQAETPKAVNSFEDNATELLSEQVQNAEVNCHVKEPRFEKIVENSFRSDNISETQTQMNDSTVYMDLINDNCKNDNHSKIIDNTVGDNIRDVQESIEIVNHTNASNLTSDSTVYMDLPSMLVKETNDFLHSERVVSSKDREFADNVTASTPKGSDTETTLECHKTEDLSETKLANDIEVNECKMEQKSVPEHTLSPFESPTKSHPTDTYDENSSVLLGPFENCSTEALKQMEVHTKTDVEFPKEELLAFSSNFSDINLATPSPLRDGNFLNEVPDIAPEDLVFDDITVSEVKDKSDSKTENTDESDQSVTTKHVSPSTPPNSPGYYLASTSQQKYLVDIDFDAPEPQSYPAIESDSGLSSLQKEIDLNQIELQITSKLAMAENENNMNIEYSGPLTVEGLVSGDELILGDSEAIPDTILAGNGGFDDMREGLSTDEDNSNTLQALRNELELKLPLAQVACIEPEWDGVELPPPPELVLSYGGAPAALSPIAEETRHQLRAYENDAWNTSTRTDSSESYPEPCNNSTDEVTDLPTAPDGRDALDSNTHSHLDSTYTIHSGNHDTYTVQKEVPSTKETTMTADSLNGSPHKKPANDASSTANDKTYTKNDDDKESNLERISQVSPFLLSPTTDTSAPGDSDNATRVSTLSKTTAPTDAKHSKPTDGLSKATSIDSWCSNDTLYNVEENFDDLALEPDAALHNENLNEDKEEPKDDIQDHSDNSTETLTHHSDHESTYIIHESNSEPCDTFSPDSITADANHSDTKPKTEATGATASVITKSTNDTPTKDLAYGTLPSCSNCSAEVRSGYEEQWRLERPELIRRSQFNDEPNITPPNITQIKDQLENTPSPKLSTEPHVDTEDNVDISYIKDNSNQEKDKTDSSIKCVEASGVKDSPKPNCREDIGVGLTSTPLEETSNADDDVEPIPMNFELSNIPFYQTLPHSDDIRPQDFSTNQETDLLLEDCTKNRELVSGYIDFATLAAARSQDNLKGSFDLEQNRLNYFRNSPQSPMGELQAAPRENEIENEITDFLVEQRSFGFSPNHTNNSNTASDLLLVGAVDPYVPGESNSLSLPTIQDRSPQFEVSSIPFFESFLQSAEHKPQDLSTSAIRQASPSENITPENYTRSSPSMENRLCSGDFRQSESSVRSLPQNTVSLNTNSLSVSQNKQDDSKCDSFETTDESRNLSTRPHDSTDNKVETSVAERTPTYSDFESSAVGKPQEIHSRSIQSESGIEQSEGSVPDCPQDLTSPTNTKAHDSLVNSHGESEPSKNETSPTKPPSVLDANESQLPFNIPVPDPFLNNLDVDDENEQPHSIIITEDQRAPIPYEITTLSSVLFARLNESNNTKIQTAHNAHTATNYVSPNATYNSHCNAGESTFDSHIETEYNPKPEDRTLNGIEEVTTNENTVSKLVANGLDPPQIVINNASAVKEVNGTLEGTDSNEILCNGSEKFAVVNFLCEPFEELENNIEKEVPTDENTSKESLVKSLSEHEEQEGNKIEGKRVNGVLENVCSVTEDFLRNEQDFCQHDGCLPLLNDIRFTGPASEIMSTSFTQDSPTEPNSPECEQDNKPNIAAAIAKEWDSDTESQTSNSSSGEFIWKDGNGYETSLAPTTQFNHHGGVQHGGVQHGGGGSIGDGASASRGAGQGGPADSGSGGSGDSGDSGSGSDGDEVEFVPSSWDCRAAPAKSSLRSLEQTPPDNKKRVVFKRQKYHCVYEYPREVADETHSPAYLPDLSTYCDWDPTSCVDAEIGYGQLFGGPSPLDLYPLRGVAYGPDYDEDFFISSSARPFESLGIMSTTSQFFPGKQFKPSLLEQDIDTDVHFPPPPSPLPTPNIIPPLTQTTPSLDFTTPDSGVEDITPITPSNEEDFKKKLPESETHCWRGMDSGSSSESVSPSSPGGEALGGLRHTRDKLKLDLPPSPHVPSPRHMRVFNFVLDKPRRKHPETSPGPPPAPQTPLVMTDETPVVTTNLSLPKEEDVAVPEPTFSTFGKSVQRTEDHEQKMILDEVEENEAKEEIKEVEGVKGEGTVLDSGDEDSGIESTKATLERKTPNVS